MQQFRVGNKRAERPQIKKKNKKIDKMFLYTLLCALKKTTYIELLGAAEERERVMMTESAPDSGRNEVRFFSVVCCRTN